MYRAERAVRGRLHGGPLDLLGRGALVWRTIVERLAGDVGITEVVTSEHDILDGIALSIALG